MSWSNWRTEAIGITVAGAPAVTSWKEGHLDVFVRSADNRLFHRAYENELWQGQNWVDLSDGHKIEVSPGAVSWGPNRIDLFAVWDKQVHHRFYLNGVWNPWAENLGGVTNDAPAAAAWKPDRVDVLVHTTDNFMARRFWDSTNVWRNWENIGGVSQNLMSAPAAVATGSNRIDCFGRNPANHLIHASYQEAKQENWMELDGLSIKDAPAAVSGVTADRGRVDVLVRSADDLLKHRVYYSRLVPEQPAGDTIYVVQPGDTLQKIALDHNMTVQTLLNLNPQINPISPAIKPGDKIIIGHHGPVPGTGGWEAGTTWDNISANKISSAPAAVAWWSLNILKRIDCFVLDSFGNLVHTWWK